jgi:hypothetical protein
MKEDGSEARPQNASKVNLHRKEDVLYWTNALKCSSVELSDAVQHVGDSSKKVRAYLKEKNESG